MKPVSNELSRALAQATQVVRRFVSGEASAAEFVKDYEDFYYYEALDGHEVSSAQDIEGRQRFWVAIHLHKRIQLEVVNQILLDPTYSKEEIREAGRIDETEARQRAQAICAVVGLTAVLESLELPGKPRSESS